ncbi:DUSP domain-containing protein [Ditylenchus destructor]|uniref:DUSP domain-containing protein n=1 Tax=Ditylenchus destructor TaxID=166010 RepID=A0AAD4MUJ5_9BILA|nr:DUSP domain-containing protein [Ditylenchus destructor]
MRRSSRHTQANSLSVEEARGLLELTKNSELNVGENWYLISQKWWREFMTQITYSWLCLPPISNEQLVRKVEHSFDLKPNLLELFDFTPVPEPVFEELRNRFGFELEERDIIQRRVIKGDYMGQQIFIEYYLLELKIARFAEQNNVISLKVSRADTTDEIREKAMNALNIPPYQHRTAQFLIEQDNEYECLPKNIPQVKLNELFDSKTVIYIDETGIGLQLNQLKSESSTPNGTQKLNGIRRSMGTKRSSKHSRTNAPSPKTIKTEDIDGSTRKLIENDEAAEQILELIHQGKITSAEKLLLSSVYGPVYEGDQELILAVKTQAFIELLRERNKDDTDQSLAIFKFGESIADLASGIQNLTPKIEQKVQGALLLSYGTNLLSAEHAHLLKEDERTNIANLIKGVFEAYETLKKAKEG